MATSPANNVLETTAKSWGLKEAHLVLSAIKSADQAENTSAKNLSAKLSGLTAEVKSANAVTTNAAASNRHSLFGAQKATQPNSQPEKITPVIPAK